MSEASHTVVSWFCFVGSVLTLMLGTIFVIFRIEQLRLAFESCDFVEADCNRQWRLIFTFRPNTFLDLWTPVFMGFLGMSVHLFVLRLASWFDRIVPAGYIGYGVFMIITAFFANFGYCGKIGVILGIYCLLSGFLCIAANFAGGRKGDIKYLFTGCRQ